MTNVPAILDTLTTLFQAAVDSDDVEVVRARVRQVSKPTVVTVGALDPSRVLADVGIPSVLVSRSPLDGSGYDQLETVTVSCVLRVATGAVTVDPDTDPAVITAYAGTVIDALAESLAVSKPLPGVQRAWLAENAWYELDISTGDAVVVAFSVVAESFV